MLTLHRSTSVFTSIYEFPDAVQLFVFLQCKETWIHSWVTSCPAARTNVRASFHLQPMRKWRCCCVGWQDLQGRDFLLGSPLQLDTETAVNHPWSRARRLSALWAVFCVWVREMKKTPLLRLKENISLLIQKSQIKRRQQKIKDSTHADVASSLVLWTL